MEVSSFSEIQTEFITRIQKAVYCNMATVDRKSHPRSRIMHPIWDGHIGWVISWPETLKSKHLQDNPDVSLAYIQDSIKPVYVDAKAEWVNEADEKLRIWELHKSIPTPLGFDPEPNYGTINNNYYGLLRFTPWRIALGDLHGEPIIWRQK
ncbi:MAG TPA: pyridoxamine 5'-phosphate oxidase family protein [Anaerolineales bacterium]|nr:pyridoxamine 5'-phosphate oxidase family protein [Anaerolineales bacterium]